MTQTNTPSEAIHYRLLLVDDDQSLVKKIQQWLQENLPVSVEVAYNGKEGYDLMAELSPQRYDLVLLGILIPGLNGVEVCQMVARDKALRDTPIVLMSELPLRSSAFQRSLHHYDEFSVVVGVLEKPLQSDVFLHKVRAVLGDKQRKVRPT